MDSPKTQSTISRYDCNNAAEKNCKFKIVFFFYYSSKRQQAHALLYCLLRSSKIG